MNRKWAFTLVECMIAVAIVAIGPLSILSILAWVRLHNDLEQERSRAHQIVSEAMENLRLELYTCLTAGDTVTVWDNGTPDITSDDTIGNLEVIIFDPETNALLEKAPDHAKRVGVEVTLSWNPRGRLSGKTYRETVMTYLSPSARVRRLRRVQAPIRCQ